jgi:hypothetical protein
MGLSVAGVVARGATGAGSTEEEIRGYRAVFWMCFGALGVSCFVGIVGFWGVYDSKEMDRRDSGDRRNRS